VLEGVKISWAISDISLLSSSGYNSGSPEPIGLLKSMASPSTNGTTPLRIFTFESPRTNSQLFHKLFSQHPQLAWGLGFHPFAGAQMYGPERLSQRTRHCEAAERGQTEWGTKYPGMGNEDTIEGSKKDLRERISKSEKAACVLLRRHIITC